MIRQTALFLVLFHFFSLDSPGQVRIRLFAGLDPGSVFITVSQGRYELDSFDGPPLYLSEGESVIISRYENRLALKTRDGKGFSCDSVFLKGISGNDTFTFRKNGSNPVRRLYSNDLLCYHDMETLMLINICDEEKYIAGVVKAEGGSGRNAEYFKSQAVLVRTYLYGNLNRHIIDHYNLCDDVHCQAFHGITSDQVIVRAAEETRGLVVVDKDSILIMPSFHSNCGGETSGSGEVWLTGKSYLRSVRDPWCTSSPNAVWQKSIPFGEWVGYLRKNGYNGSDDNPAAFSFPQVARTDNYRVGNFVLPFSVIRNDLGLKSSFFSVTAGAGSVELRGRGYGHGVGLCQEGAMVMASRGNDFRKIIAFYFSDVIITDIGNAKNPVSF